METAGDVKGFAHVKQETVEKVLLDLVQHPMQRETRTWHCYTRVVRRQTLSHLPQPRDKRPIKDSPSFSTYF